MSKQQPTRSRGRGKTNSGQQGSSEPVAIEDLGSSNTIVVNTSPSTSPTLTTTAAPTTRIIVRSPEPIQYDELSSCQQSSSLESHTHEFSELSIGEQFGRRHGQDWPAGSFVRCASCPNGREKPRSHSRGRRRMSGVLYKAITPRPVLSAQSFQEARKSEEEIAAMKGKQVQEYYQSLNGLLDSFAEVEEILKEHRAEEQAKAQILPQLPPFRPLDSLLPVAKASDNQSIATYGSTSGTTTPSNVPTIASIPEQPMDVAKRSNGHLNGGHGSDEPTGDLEEGTPLIGFTRKQRTSPRLVSLAINVSFMANVFLVIIKIWTVLFSDSLAVLASMIDSLMDLLSGAIIWYSARLRSNTSDGHRYPVGKARMEPLGIIVFASVMVTSFLQVMLQSFERLLAGADEPVDLGIIILSLLGLNIFIKFALWAWCRTMKDSSSVQALAQDHLNDVVFNVFSTLFPVAGQFMGWWWLDAVGAVVLSIYIITEWTGTCLHNIRRLTGQAATAADIQQLTYMAYRFSNLIQAIDTVRAYYVGDGLFVEVDIVLPPDTPLSQAHDVGESLQGALERLDSVERAFVHVDYNAVHAIEHR